MIGVWVNGLSVVAGGLLGCLLRGGLKEKYRTTVNHALALAVICIGMSGALGTGNTLLVIVSLVLGSLAGEALALEARLEALGAWAQRRLSRGDGGFAAGFVNASLLFCVGAMAVVGALEAGLRNKPDTLLAKALIDGVAAIIFASSFGVGVCFSAVPLTLYQGGIALLAGVLSPLLTDGLISELSATGSVLIIGIGLNMLGATKERIRVGNMLPAVLVPCLWEALSGLFR